MPPQPRQLSRAFKVLISIVVAAAALVFILIAHHPDSGPQLRDVGVSIDRWWMHEERPKALPTPLPQPSAAPRAIYMQAQPTPVPPPPAPCEECRERLERYQKALASEIAIRQSNDTLETPQLFSPNGPPSPNFVSKRSAPPHTILAWTWIYATLETGINSDHPGDVIARVSEDVKDSVTQSEVLIPQGSMLHGFQKGRSQVEQNDTGLLVEFDTLTMPNGAEIPLPKVPAADSQGYPGLSDQVDNHYVRTWSPALLIAAITAGTMLAQNPTYGSYQGYNAEQQALGAGASSLGGNANARLASSLNTLKPTLTIRPGYVMRVLVNRDMTFDGPYQQ